ncbi:hypothetical protein ACQPWY_15185 [Pseudonocardia xinjiangensis]|uniref:hypothetical protein n=1 Tax=Pseudonocardia xinjiangensis TaxID=75289 RepID=UPI003D8B4A46
MEIGIHKSSPYTGSHKAANDLPAYFTYQVEGSDFDDPADLSLTRAPVPPRQLDDEPMRVVDGDRRCD